jgi:O-6-methylguanine DNA methyltransferase
MLLLKNTTSPLGDIVLGASQKGICMLEFKDSLGEHNSIHYFSNKLKGSKYIENNEILETASHQLNLYFSGFLEKFDLPIDMHGTVFQLSVWRKLNEIPYGKLVTYKDLATRLGGASLSRAVAQSNASNRISIIIPCHRVISGNGKLSGYRGGLNRKQRLIDLELQNYSLW